MDFNGNQTSPSGSGGSSFTPSYFTDGKKVSTSYTPSSGSIVSGTWYPIEATRSDWRVNADQTDWSVSYPTTKRTLYTYNGTTRKFYINASITLWMETGSSATFCNLACFINGAELSNSQCQGGARVDNESAYFPNCLSCNTIYEINNGDTLEFYLQPLVSQSARMRVYQMDYSITAVS